MTSNMRQGHSFPPSEAQAPWHKAAAPQRPGAAFPTDPTGAMAPSLSQDPAIAPFGTEGHLHGTATP